MLKGFSEGILIQKSAADLLEQKLWWHHVCIMTEQKRTEIKIKNLSRILWIRF